MKTVTTKAIAKVAAVATGLAMATSMLSLAPMAHAASLTASQVSSILSLLSSFGAGADTIANVNAALTGAPVTTTTTTTTGSSYTFTRDLTVGSKGADVTALQNALIAKGFSIAAGATGYFGAQTVAAVKAWQVSAGVTPAAGYFGPKSRAAFGGGVSTGGTTTTTTGGTVTAGTGNGLKVMLAADSPNNVALVAGQAIGAIAKFTFANPTSAEIKVTNLGLKRTGISNDATISNVYLYNGATRLTDAGGVSSGAFSFNDPTGLFTVPAGQTVSISVLADIATGTSGQQVGAQLVSVTSTGTLDSSVAFPINGYTQTVSSATLATVDYGATTLPAENTALTPANDVTVWQNTVTIGTRAVTLKSFQLQNIGSVAATDVNNLRLYVDGVQTGSAASINANNIVTWDLSAAPLRLETGGRVIKVVGDVVGGSSLTFKLDLRRASDAQMVDTDLNQPVLATAAGSAFSARHGGVQTVASGTVSVVKAANSPSANVSLGASNVKWASYEMRAAGEDVKIDNLDVMAMTSNDHGLDNGKIFLNGVQVGSTKDLTDSNGSTGAVNFTFGSSFILKAGATAIVDVYADAKTSTGAAYTSGETAQIRLFYTASSANGTGQVSLSSIDVPGSNVDGNAITLSSSTVTMTKYSGYGNQTMIAGTSGARLGSFVLSTGSTEGVNVNTIAVTLSANEAATVTDLKLVDNATGAQIGTVKPTPASGASGNSFSVNLNISASGTKVIDVIGSIKSSSNVGPWIAAVDGSGTGISTGSSVTFGDSTSGTLQTITVSTADLTAAVGVSPNNANVIAGASMVKVGSFDFTSRYSYWNVDKIRVTVPSNAATSVASVVLAYPDVSGNTVQSTAVLASPASTEVNATATFTGLTFYIPANTTKKLDVYVNLASIQNDGDTGKSITVTLDSTGGFNKTDSAGTVNTTLNASDLASNATSGKGTMYVRKSLPTISAVALDSTTLSAGTNKTIARFKVTADAAGDIAWAKVAFKIQKTFGITLGATSTMQLWQGSNTVAGTFATTTGSLLAQTQAFPVADGAAATTDLNLAFIPTAEQTVPAGTSLTYELRTTVGGLATNGNSLDVSIANRQTSASTTAAASVVGTDANTTNSFIWSDKSRVSETHALTTADWTDDYLVNTLPLTVGNLSVTI